MRIGEALTLQAGDIDLGSRCVHIKRTWGSRTKAAVDRLEELTGRNLDATESKQPGRSPSRKETSMQEKQVTVYSNVG
jgi:integrase